jgi:hypothetical protein
MIVRILGEGQFDVPEAALDALNDLDDELMAAIDAGDTDEFTSALGALLAKVRSHAAPHPLDTLDQSDLVLPGPDSSMEQVRELLGEEGLIPG